MSIERDAKRYRALRAYSQAVRDWYRAHPDYYPGDPCPEPKPFFACGVVMVLEGEDLDLASDEWNREHESQI